VVADRSYSRIAGTMSLEIETWRPGASSRRISRIRCSCARFLNDQRKQTPIASTPSATSSRAAARALSSFSGTTTRPAWSTRSKTSLMRGFGTIGRGLSV
jgi:hypothetical protein